MRVFFFGVLLIYISFSINCLLEFFSYFYFELFGLSWNVEGCGGRFRFSKFKWTELKLRI